MIKLALKITASFCVAVIFMSVAYDVDIFDDQKEQAAEHKSYCELVLMWEQDAEQGIEPVNRDGMPNYKGLECE